MPKAHSLVYSSRPQYLAYRRGAEQRALRFDLSREEFDALVDKDCGYCGAAAPSGVDRIDSTFGYVSGNVQPVCKHCNYAKGNLTEGDFKTWIARLVAFQTKKT